MAETTAAALPASPPPLLRGLPLLGNLVDFARDPVATLARGHREHGRAFSLNLAGKEAVVLLGPEHHRFFFEETDKLLSIREAYPFFSRMFSDRLYFFAPPDEYREQRAIVLPRFQGKQMDAWVAAMAREAEIFMDTLGDEGVFDLTPALGPVVMFVAARALVGEDFRAQLGRELFDVFRDFSAGIEAVLPLWLPLPRFRRSARARDRLHALLRTVIAERRARPAQRDDFLQTLLQATYSDGTPLDDALVINLILMLVWAGHETTVGHISWGLVDLLQHPDYLASVRAEQAEVLSGPLTSEQVRKLRRMDWTLKESERLHPVAFMLMRKAACDFAVAGHRVQKGSLVFVSPWVAHRLPDVFTDPDRYDPERFSPERGEGRAAHSLIGFGGGMHRCAGVNFAYLEMKAVLTELLRRYDLALLDPDVRPMRGAVTRWPQGPCRVSYRRRS
jgi:sterol 14-demethylase